MTQDQSARPSEAREIWVHPERSPYHVQVFTATDIALDNPDGKNEFLNECVRYIERSAYDALAAQLTEANRRLAVAREALDSITKDIQSYSGANFVVQWVLDRNVKARKALAQISAEGRDEKISDATGGE